MAINLDAAVEIAKQRAKLYADRKKGSGDPEIWSLVYNAHLDGLLECLGERESLRQMVARHEEVGLYRVSIPEPGLDTLSAKVEAMAGIQAPEAIAYLDAQEDADLL